MECSPKSLAIRNYNRRLVIALAAYIVLLVAAVLAFTRHHPTGALAYCIAVLPALPVVAMIGIFGLYLAEQKDEFQRNLIVQSMLWGMGFTLTVTTVWGFLENFVNVPHLQLYLIFPLFCVSFGLTTPLLKLRYR